QPPSADPSPCSSSPSSTKNAVAAARSSTTMPTWSMRWIVMRSTVAERRPQLQRLSVADRLVGTRRPVVWRPAMSCSAQLGRSWVREPVEQALADGREKKHATAEDDGAPEAWRGGVKLLERMIEVSGVELCSEAFG